VRVIATIPEYVRKGATLRIKIHGNTGTRFLAKVWFRKESLNTALHLQYNFTWSEQNRWLVFHKSYKDDPYALVGNLVGCAIFDDDKAFKVKICH